MKKDITFSQVAHLYLRSEFTLDTLHISSGTINIGLGLYSSSWYGDLISMCENKDEWKITPIFQPFENLIKPVKANKFVAELLGINEDEEYVMENEIKKLAGSYVRIENDFNIYFQYDEDTKNIPLISILLIAAGYNVFNIKDCRYEEVKEK